MGYKILLVDDSVTVQKIITLTFSDEGVDVMTVDNGEEAINRLQYMRPALVMADVSIPGKNGYDICAYIKGHPELKHIPVILLVPGFETYDAERGRFVGADHYLTKPFQSIRSLISTVKNLIEGKGVPEAPPPAPAQIVEEPMPAPPPVAASPDPDAVLDLDDVFAALPPPPPPVVEAVEPVEEASPEAEMPAEAILLTQAAIDEIVERVSARVTENLAERISREVADRVAASLAETVQPAAAIAMPEKPRYYDPEPLLELDEF